MTSILYYDFNHKPMLNSHSELSHCRNTRFSCHIAKIHKKNRLGGFFLISSYIIFRSSHRLQVYHLVVVGEGPVVNTIHVAVPEVEHTIAVHTNGVIAISVPVTNYKNVGLFHAGRVHQLFHHWCNPAIIGHSGIHQSWTVKKREIIIIIIIRQIYLQSGDLQRHYPKQDICQSTESTCCHCPS